MTAMNNVLLDLLHHQQKTQNDTTHAMQVIHQSQRDHANGSLFDNIPTFSGMPKLYFG